MTKNIIPALEISSAGMNDIPKNAAVMQFHINRRVRDIYNFDKAIYAYSGNVVFPDFKSIREFADTINRAKKKEFIKTTDLSAMAMIDEIMHHIMSAYRKQLGINIFKELFSYLFGSYGEGKTEEIINLFAAEFPPTDVYTGKVSTADYFETVFDGLSGKDIELEELLFLYVENINPALRPYAELFDDSKLLDAGYIDMMDHYKKFFNGKEGFGPAKKNIIDFILEPIIRHPHSLRDQLSYMASEWGVDILGEFYSRLLSNLDFIREEEKMGFGGPGEMEVITFKHSDDYPDYENYSPDKDWMPRVVMIAKSTYVWLDQLSKDYRKKITTLGDIPEEEIRKLAAKGFTVLWLIGIWERGRASETVKKLCGNPEAAASAYSLYDYVIAEDLGGEDGYNKLKAMADKYHIRLASDMVPNHMAVDSRWVENHPDWFLSLRQKPYPNYTFNGINLSRKDGIGIYIEDHYYDKTDAAVVFKRVDYTNGDVRYIYHGNDGTSMPWNDTAQLNYLNYEVREAVIRTIISIARKFPVIRFDAAMTLAKKHYQRLWFPKPGTGGDIPTRADYAMTREQFDTAFPKEFWTEVVERVAQEVPDTLLLAEAFWFMEGYFVRTLGMHRVYNSAFMHFMKDEDNAKFRESIKNVLEYDPRILQRYVNFMNNPDEETAVAQFGKDDKYFGVCTVMSTIPGLPMFGHGQIEGFTEKYGMEYRKAYWNEQVDWQLVARHEREIFPLLHKRYLFSSVENFQYYDVMNGHEICNDLIAYSNSFNGAHSLVVYNNKFTTSTGWIKEAAPKKNMDMEGDVFEKTTLGDSFDLSDRDDHYVIFENHNTGLEYIKSSKEIREKGFFVNLDAFKYAVYLNFREVQDNEFSHYGKLCAELSGKGVKSIKKEAKLIGLKELHFLFGKLVNKDTLLNLRKIRSEKKKIKKTESNEMEKSYLEFMTKLAEYDSSEFKKSDLPLDAISGIVQLPSIVDKYKKGEVKDYLLSNVSDDKFYNLVILVWSFIKNIGDAAKDTDKCRALRLFEKHMLDEAVKNVLIECGMSELHADHQLSYIKSFLAFEGALPSKKNIAEITEEMFKSPYVRKTARINTYQGTEYFNKESFEKLLAGLFIIDILDGAIPAKQEQMLEKIVAFNEAAEKSGYQTQETVVHLKLKKHKRKPKAK